MNIDGSGLKTLLSKERFEYHAFKGINFHPYDNSLILYHSEGSDVGTTDLWLFSLRNRHERVIYGSLKQKSFYAIHEATFSPKEKKIACLASCWLSVGGLVDEKRAGVLVMNNDGSGVMLVARIPWDYLIPARPTWSPEGRSLAFVTKEELTLLDLKTEKKRVILQISSEIGSPAWQPSKAIK